MEHPASYFEYTPPHHAMPQAKLYAQQALRIDNDLAEAHALLSSVYSQYEWLLRAVEAHDSLLVYFNELPAKWARIPDEPRFREVVEKIGLRPNPA
jgi:hypothetical protein